MFVCVSLLNENDITKSWKYPSTMFVCVIAADNINYCEQILRCVESMNYEMYLRILFSESFDLVIYKIYRKVGFYNRGCAQK